MAINTTQLIRELDSIVSTLPKALSGPGPFRYCVLIWDGSQRHWVSDLPPTELLQQLQSFVQGHQQHVTDQQVQEVSVK